MDKDKELCRRIRHAAKVLRENAKSESFCPMRDLQAIKLAADHLYSDFKEYR